MKILVLDDDRILAMILADHIAERGHTVTPAYDSRRALLFCKQKEFDVVVIDMVMPNLDGIDFLEQLREENRTVRAIIITGFSELLKEEADRLQALGVEAVIEKPFSFSDVDEVLDRLAPQSAIRDD